MVGKSIGLNGGLDPQLILQMWNWDELFGGTPFTHPGAFFGAAHGGDSMTRLDATSFAKGGGKSGGGGGGGGGVLATYHAGSADGELGYDIRIDFKGSGWTAALQSAFTTAADYFTAVITADIGGGGFYRRTYVDDLYITAELKAIDGTGGILGQSGPNAVWTATELTAMGKIEFDSADALNYLGQGLWDDIVTHELMHVLGFGSLWNYGENPLVVNDPNPSNSDQYIGANGLAAYNEQFGPGASFIPVENDGGSGTAGAHWDEAALGNELITGYIESSNYLSSFSLMSLADLGYTVQPQPYYGNLVA